MFRRSLKSFTSVGIAALGIVAVACSSSAGPFPMEAPPESAAPAAPAISSNAPATSPAHAPSAPSAPVAAAPAAPQTALSRDNFKQYSNSNNLLPASAPAPMGTMAPAAAAMAGGGGTVQYSTSATDSVNQVGGTSNPNDEAYDANFFKHYGVNPFIDTEDDHFSTFAMDVDTGSYSVMRRFLADGHLPHPDSVRVEEFVNYFDQDYSAPDSGAFAIHVEGAPSVFGNERHLLMKVGLQGKEITSEDRKDASLVFVIDVSGSMAREDRLELVKKSLRLLVDELRPTDDIAIVVYGSQGRVIMNPTSGERDNREYIMQVIDSLQPEGATNAAEGLVLGYELAEMTIRPNAISRVILLSDGVANVGRTGSDSILDLIDKYVDRGVTLSTVGFGMGNFNDVLMEQLANDGNGNYSYVDTLNEAERIFVQNLTGTLQVIALDSKVQVDFNPDVVRSYRLLGYENRDVADEDFRNDDIDAGEVGANHSVTALYELKLQDDATDMQATLGTVSIRYEDPDDGEVYEISRDVSVNEFARSFEDASAQFQLTAAVAEYAEILRESYWAKDGDLNDVLSVAQDARKLLRGDAEVDEFVDLVDMAEQLEDRLSLNR